jgi:primosomal protein N' (replication factor Y)
LNLHTPIPVSVMHPTPNRTTDRANPMASLFETSSDFVGYAQVIPERGIERPDGLTYGIPASLASIEAGDRVLVPLGRGNTPTAGYVLKRLGSDELAPALRAVSIKPILGGAGQAAGSGPARLTPSLLGLALWMSRYYCTPLGMVLAAMVPAAVKRGVGRRVEVRLAASEAARTAVEGEGLPKLPPGQRSVMQVALQQPAGAPPLRRVELQTDAGVKTAGPIRKLVERGLLTEHTVSAVHARWDQAISNAPDTTVTLNAEQQAVVDAVGAKLGSFGVHLLHGVTGSGKTEVYLRLASRALEHGQDAIILVPEISLTPQTAGRFLARFRNAAGDAGVAVLHSGLTAAQRHEQWAQVAAGRIRVVVGARSAVFAPLPAGRLGLLVVDEEHDGSYKQDQLPRYHARDVAIRRAQLEGATVMLGSATPSLESWHNAGRGRFTYHSLPRRATGAALPEVRLVDFLEAMRERPRDNVVHQLTPILETALVRTIADGGQVIVLLNRRGYANYICCSDQRCGWILTCDDCDATMVYHKPAGPQGTDLPPQGSVRCHHCLSERKLPTLCPQCGRKVNTFGFGTQRVEAEIDRLFPDFELGREVLRLDSDTMRRAGDYFDALERFRLGEARILVGTQMIAKGLDFPNVRLVGVINADTALALPDFRAAERTYQLVSQVAGRCGRAEHPGLVIVQTMQPDAPVIRYAAAHDYERFASEELAMRAKVGLPPSTRMVRIVVRDRDHVKCYELAMQLAAKLRALREECPGVKVRGPMPCPISRIAGYHRHAIELMALQASELQRMMTAARNRKLLKADARTAVDVDPIAML